MPAISKVSIRGSVPFIVIDKYSNRARAKINDEDGSQTQLNDTTILLFTLEGNEDFAYFKESHSPSLSIANEITETLQDLLHDVTEFK